MSKLESHGTWHPQKQRKSRPRKRIGLVAFAICIIAMTAYSFQKSRFSKSDATAPETVQLAPPPATVPATESPAIMVATTGSLHFAAMDRRLPFEPSVPELTNVETVSRLPAEKWVNVTVAPGDNLSLIFSRLKLSKTDLHTITQLEGNRAYLRNLKPGQTIRLDVHDDEISRLVVEVDDLNSLWVERGEHGFASRVETIEPEIRVAAATAEIHHSLFLDGQKVGLSDAIIMRLTEIFGWDIDFALDIRRDDRFSVIYEEVYKDGQLIKQDRILAAEFVNQGRSHRAVLYTHEGGDSAYYSDEGTAMRKAFLRTPVNFTRISSKFNLSRKHPILNTIRAHRGVDYAAPMGTPVLATANGNVRAASTTRGYGLAVELQHGKSYSTLYAHLSRFAKGVRRGASVKQGQIIGYVGKSGLATGPHLHYEFRVDGNHRNPLTVDLPKALPLEARYRNDFRLRTAPYLNQLDTLLAKGAVSQSIYIAQIDTSKFLPAVDSERSN